MKKVLAILLALAMVFSMAGVVSADDTTQGAQSSETTSVKTVSQDGEVKVEHDVSPNLQLSIPAAVIIGADLTGTCTIGLSGVRLPVDGMANVTVSGPEGDGFYLTLTPVTGFASTSKIQYFITRDDGSDVNARDNVVLEVSPGVSQNEETITFSTTEEMIAKATLSGKHTGRLTFTAGSYTNPNANTELTIGDIEQLKVFAQSVNNGNTYAGSTVKLTADIDLKGEKWTPIGDVNDIQSPNTFKGTFDGQGHTIKNLQITEGDGINVGFFGVLNGNVQDLIFEGAVLTPEGDDVDDVQFIGVVAGRIFPGGTIEDVTVKNAKIAGNHYLGGIAGHVYGSVKNCDVIDSEIVAVPNGDAAKGYDNGDKVGGIVGLHVEDTSGVLSGNTVTGTVLKAYRDVGGIAGGAEGSKVTGSTVTDVLIIVDQKTVNAGDKPANAGEFFGPRFEDTTVDGSNKHENVDIWIHGDDTITTFAVSSATAVRGFAMDVDSGNDYEGMTIKLMKDIDLGEEVFDPIGSYRQDKAFKGTFDGQGNTISNLNQNTWALNNGYYYSDLGLGLFGLVEDATIKNLNIDGASISGDSALCGVVAAVSSGTTTYENIIVSNSNCADYQYYAGGIVGWASGEQTFINCHVDDSNNIAAQWGDFNNAIGGVIGGAAESAEILLKDCIVECRIDAYNDVTSAYEWSSYRRAGMLIGDTSKTTVVDDTTYAAAPQLTCENVTVIYGEWANYHYCNFTAMEYPYVRCEAGVSNSAYSNPRYGHPTDANGNTVVDDNHVHNDDEKHKELIVFNQLYGGKTGDRYCTYGTATHDGVTVIYNNK